MSERKVKIGVVGLGNMGSGHMMWCSEIPTIELAACCDIVQEKAEKFGKQYNIPYFTDAEEMMKSGLIEAIVIAVPHYDHTTITVKAFSYGLHVLTEKPIAVHKNDALKMIKAHEEHPDKIFAAMFQQRLSSVYRKLRELIQRGEFGEIQRINWIVTTWFRSQTYYDSGTWRATWKGEGGGVLLNQCPHHIDLFQWLFGMPSKVRANCAIGKYHKIEVEDEVTAFFEYKNGATGVFITTTGEAPGTNRFEVSGTRGKLLCENGKLIWYRNATDSQEYSKNAEGAFDAPALEIIEVQTDGKNPQHVGIINNFTNAILGLEKQFVQGMEGINGVELMNAIELSGWKGGEKIALPISDDEYYEELQKRCAMSKEKMNVVEKVMDTSGSY